MRTTTSGATFPEMALLRGLLVALGIAVGTIVFGGSCIVAALLGVRDRRGGVYAWAPRSWGRLPLWLGGVRVVEHGTEHKAVGRIYVANHLGNFDIFALASVLPWVKFVAKAELFRIPFFGMAMRRAGMVPIERANRKSAFASYESAVTRIRQGASVGVYPEGTRGHAYALRPFKKGPFVFAIQAQVPVVPVYIHGVLEVQRKGQLAVRPGTLHVHYLPPIEPSGLGYEDREALAVRAYEAMAACALERYGVVSPPAGRR